MSDKKQQKDNSQALPFFARYLEGQFSENFEDLSEEEMQEVQGGLRFPVKPKHPRSKDDDIVGTLKFPNDQADVGHIPTYYTKKYPSDGDDHIDYIFPSNGKHN